MPKNQLWDDEKFKSWLKDGAESQGMTVLEALKAAGLSRFYLKPPTGSKRVDGRQTNAVLNLAQVINKSPAELFGLPDLTPQLETMMRSWREFERHLPHADSDSDDETDLRVQRMTVAARVIAGQLAAFIYAASDRADTDPAILLQMIMHEINSGARKRKAAVKEPSA